MKTAQTGKRKCDEDLVYILMTWSSAKSLEYIGSTIKAKDAIKSEKHIVHTGHVMMEYSIRERRLTRAWSYENGKWIGIDKGDEITQFVYDNIKPIIEEHVDNSGNLHIDTVNIGIKIELYPWPLLMKIGIEAYMTKVFVNKHASNAVDFGHPRIYLN